MLARADPANYPAMTSGGRKRSFFVRFRTARRDFVQA
jgi:hypothetical protein